LPKPNRQPANRKAIATLSAEDELAELLADPTLRPTINFLGIGSSISTGADTEADTDSDGVPKRQTAFVPLRIYNKDRSVAQPEAPASPQTSHLPEIVPVVSEAAPVSVAGTDPISEPQTIPALENTRADPASDLASIADTDPAPVFIQALVRESAEPLELEDAFTDEYPRKPRYQRPKARRARTVEDGHSHAEQSLYSVLWERAKSHNSDARVITIGFGTMSHLARLSLNNCRQNVRSLIHKLAVEEIRAELSNEKIGKTYLVYGNAAILRRRKASGLEWVIRTKGVVFVDPATGAVLTDRSPVKQAGTAYSISDTETVADPQPIPATP
jgi:hypothetical protein